MKRTNGDYSVRRLAPQPSDGQNSLPRWAIEYDIYPDTTGMTGTGIIAHSRSTFVYLTASSTDAEFIAEAFNLNQRFHLDHLEHLTGELRRAWENLSPENLAIAVDNFLRAITRQPAGDEQQTS